MTVAMRALAVWALLLLLAILNGAFRETVLVGRLGALRGHQVSTVLLAGLILATTGLLRHWLDLPDERSALLVGGAWVAFTLAFELLGGHFLFGRPWPALLADHDAGRGRIWPLVLVATGLAPWIWTRAG